MTVIILTYSSKIASAKMSESFSLIKAISRRVKD